MDKNVVLLIEDNYDIMEANKRLLDKAGYELQTARTLAEARSFLIEHPPDAIVLDVMLPDGSGIDFIAEIREHTVAPVLILSSLAQKDHRLLGLRAGGDDYITKPYDVDELRERVAAFLRRDRLIRKNQLQQTRFTCGELTLDTNALRAFLHDEDLLLTQKEFALLLVFVQNKGSTLRNEELYERIWNQPMMEDAGALKVVVSRLRKKLIDSEFDIITVRGEGYVFDR